MYKTHILKNIFDLKFSFWTVSCQTIFWYHTSSSFTLTMKGQYVLPSPFSFVMWESLFCDGSGNSDQGTCNPALAFLSISLSSLLLFDK